MEDNGVAAGAAPLEDAAEARPATHTPGPWVVEHGESLSIRDVATDSRLCTLNWLKGRHGLAGRLSDEEVSANALAFAAAPDLLEACRAAEEWLEGWASAEPYLSVIKAAIAKATTPPAR